MPGRQEDLGAQEFDVVGDGRRDLALDPSERMQRLRQLVLLEVDPCQPVRRLVADFLVDVRLEHRLDRAPGAMVHAVVQLEIAHVELRVADVGIQRVEAGLVEPVVLAEFRIETLERVEIVALVRVVQRFAEVQVAQVGAHARARRQRAGNGHREQWTGRSRHSLHQWPSSIGARPESGPASVSPTIFGPTSLLNENCAVRLKSAPPADLPSTCTSSLWSPLATLPT
jgi:hypothetical protein